MSEIKIKETETLVFECFNNVSTPVVAVELNNKKFKELRIFDPSAASMGKSITIRDIEYLTYLKKTIEEAMKVLNDKGNVEKN